MPTSKTIAAAFLVLLAGCGNEQASDSPPGGGDQQAEVDAAFMEAVAAPDDASADGSGADVVSLFDGKTLNGWKGDPAYWRVEDGVLVGETPRVFKQEFDLVTEESYSDFVLKISYRLLAGNSGVRIRATPISETKLSCYEVDICEKNDDTGNIFDPADKFRTLHMVPDDRRPRLNSVIKQGEWNDYVIMAVGSRITVSLNGFVCHDFVLPPGHHEEGAIALNLRNKFKTRIEFREITLQNLSDRESAIAQASGFRRADGRVELPAAEDAGGDVRVAVFDFKDLGPSVSLAPLRRSLADMLLSDLPRYEGVTVVERMRVEGFLQERQLENMALTESAGSKQGQRLLGADYYLTATYSSSDEQIVIKAQLFRTGDKQPTKAWEVRGKPGDLFQLEEDLLTGVLAGVGIAEPQERPQRAADTETPLVVAVFPFENHSVSAKLDPMQQAFGEILQINLSSLPGLQVVDRDSLQKVLDEQKLTLAQLTDPLTALQVGQLLGANRLLFGAITQVGDGLRFDVRIADTETASLVATTTLQGEASDPFGLIERLALQVADSIGAVVGDDADRLVAGSTPTRNLEAVMYFGTAQKALLERRHEAAREAFERMLLVEPESIHARWGLLQIAAWFQKHDRALELATDLVGRDLASAQIPKNRVYEILLYELMARDRVDDVLRYAEEAGPLPGYLQTGLAAFRAKHKLPVSTLADLEQEIAQLRAKHIGRRLSIRPNVDAVEQISQARAADGWDRFTIAVQGNHLSVAANGVPIAEYEDEFPNDFGMIGLSLDTGKTSRLLVKNIRVRGLAKNENPADITDEQMQPLFDGSTLDGWTGDTDDWKIEDGVMVGAGSANKLKLNIEDETRRTDFLLKLTCRAEEGRAGLFFRAQRLANNQLTGYWVTLGPGFERGHFIDRAGMSIDSKLEILNALRRKFRFFDAFVFARIIGQSDAGDPNWAFQDSQGRDVTPAEGLVETVREIIAELRYSHDNDLIDWLNDQSIVEAIDHCLSIADQKESPLEAGEARELVESALESFGWHALTADALRSRLAKLDSESVPLKEFAAREKALRKTLATRYWEFESNEAGMPSLADDSYPFGAFGMERTRRNEWLTLARHLEGCDEPAGVPGLYQTLAQEYGPITASTKDIIDGLRRHDQTVQWPDRTVLIWGGQEMVRDAWRDLKELSDWRVHCAMGASPTFAHFAPYSLVVVDSPGYRSYTPDECLALQAYVASGGSLLVVVSPGFREAQPITLQPLLAMFGASAGTEETLRAKSTSVTPHPITKGVTSAMARNAVSLSVPEAGKVLIKSKNQNLLAAMPYGRGRVVLASFGQWFLPAPRRPSNRPNVSSIIPRASHPLDLPLERGPRVEVELLGHVVDWLLEPQHDAEAIARRQVLARSGWSCLQYGNFDRRWEDVDEMMQGVQAELAQHFSAEVADRCTFELYNSIVWPTIDYGRLKFLYDPDRTDDPATLVQLARNLHDRYPGSADRLVYDYLLANAKLRWAEWRFLDRGIEMNPEALADAYKAFAQIDAPEKSHLWAWSRLRPAWSLIRNEQFEEAMALAQPVADRMPVSLEKGVAMIILADCLKKSDQRDQAVRYWKALVEFPKIGARELGTPKYLGFGQFMTGHLGIPAMREMGLLKSPVQ